MLQLVLLLATSMDAMVLITMSVGRLYVPAEGKCLGVTNFKDKNQPWQTTLVKCASPPTLEQRWKVYYNSDNRLYWVRGFPIPLLMLTFPFTAGRSLWIARIQRRRERAAHSDG